MPLDDCRVYGVEPLEAPRTLPKAAQTRRVTHGGSKRRVAVRPQARRGVRARASRRDRSSPGEREPI